MRANGALERFSDQIVEGDCRELLPQLLDEWVDLIVTSPPYADQRKHLYGGVHPDEHVEGFLPISAQLKRVQGWLWTEKYIWHKKNTYPGKWLNRFRDAWERCLHFTKQKPFKMFQEAED
jgi:DNA modification methylase